MLLWDEFYYVDFIRALREGGDWLPWVWRQHNEHRIVPVKLVMAPLALFTDWNLRDQMSISVLLAAGVVFGLWRLYRLGGSDSPLLFAPVSWLVCSLAQYENMLYGLLMCHYFTLLGLVWALVGLVRGSAASVAGAAICGALASCTIVNGFLIWPIGLLLLVARGTRARGLVLWCVLAGLTTLAYFHDFVWPSGTPSRIGTASVVETLQYFVIALGAPLASGSRGWSQVVGIAVLAIGALALARGLGTRSLGAAGALVLLGVLSCFLIAIGRSTSIPPLESRYIAYSTLTFLGIHLYLCSPPAGSTLSPGRAAWLGLLVPGLIAAQLTGFQQARKWRDARMAEKFLLQTYGRQPDAALSRLYRPAEVRSLASYLESNRLGPFAEPQDLLILVEWQQGVALGELLPNLEIEQRFSCPVRELWDVAVPFAAYGRRNLGTVRLTLHLDGRELAARTVSASAIGDDQWIGMRVDPPVSCDGRELALRIESPDGTSGSAVTVWTYPRYYSGGLRQGSHPGPTGRSLGLALNGMRYGVIRP